MAAALANDHEVLGLQGDPSGTDPPQGEYHSADIMAMLVEMRRDMQLMRKSMADLTAKVHGLSSAQYRG